MYVFTANILSRVLSCCRLGQVFEIGRVLTKQFLHF